MPRSTIASAILILFIMTAAAHGETFRCPNGAIVSEGDKLAEVRIKCDPPTYLDKRYEPAGRHGDSAVEVQDWTYDRGTTEFVYYLTFTNGYLTKIVSGGYGTGKKLP